jgi:hypothetical protein
MQSDPHPNPDRSREALEARLRALPRLAVPVELEGRLLAAAPARLPIRQRRRAFRVGLLAALAATCLLAVLTWRRPRGEHVVAVPKANEPAPRAVVPPSNEFPSIASWRKTQSLPDGGEIPSFTWPVEERWSVRAATSIPAELLD